MAKRVTTITKETTEAAELEAAEATSQQTEEPTPAESELRDFFDTIAGGEVTIKIYKVVNGTQAYCGSAEPATITEDAILQKWGGGRYVLKAVHAGRYAASRSITLYESPENALRPSSNSTGNSSDNSTGEIAALRENLNRQHEILLTMMGAKQAGNSPQDILAMLQTFQAMQPKTPDFASILPNIIDLFKSTMEMSRDAGGSGDSKMDMLKMALDKLPLVVGALSAMRKPEIPNQPIHVPATQPPEIMAAGAAAELDPSQVAALQQGINWLKSKALKGGDPGLILDWIEDNLTDPTYQRLALNILNKPFENLFTIDPELSQEPLRAWFEKFYRGLKRIYADTEDDNVAGESGSSSDAKGNEAPDD